MAHREYVLVVLGAGGVGKSALTVQFVHGKFLTRYDPTIEDSYRKPLEVDGVACTLDIMDTAGQEEYSALVDQFMKNGHGFMLVYSITSPTSFRQIKDLNLRIQRVHGMAMPLVLVGNKADLEDQREVERDTAESWAKELKCPSVEVSAKTNLNVTESFVALVREVNAWRNAHPEQNTTAEVKKKKCSLF